ncbi:hypothetical protein [Ramlibacter sp. AN1133]|uniref:hypothetical protein n=1 Tax=Ramlibacter sp. AN1133 TaxID=3133429 RepID=UPI0030BB9112
MSVMGLVLGAYPALSGVLPWLLMPARVLWSALLLAGIPGLLLAATGSAASKQAAPGARLSGRGRVIALGLIGSALTCTAGTVTTALLEGVSGLAWRAVLSRLLVSYCAAAAVVVFLFPWLMPRLMARLESRATVPAGDWCQPRARRCPVAHRSAARRDRP